MTNQQQHPAQFDWATELLDAQGHVTLSAQEANEIGARLRSMGDKLKAYEDLDEAASDVQLLRMGYAAARLEIESLQARIKTMAEEHADELMVAHLDGRMRVAQLAGAQQPGAATWALPDADSDYMRKVVAVAVTMLFDSYKEDVTRAFSTGELSEFVTITAAMGGERVEDIYRRAWDLLSLPVRASHGQAPAQAAPQQEAQEPAMFVSAKQLAALTDPDDPDGEHGRYLPVRKTSKGLFTQALYTAPQPSPTPQADSVTAPAAGAVAHTISDAQIEAMPVWRNFVGLWPESRREIVDAVVDLLAAAPTPPTQAADSVLEDALRYRWLRIHAIGAFRTNNGNGPVSVYHLSRIPALAGIPEETDAAIDAARKQGENHD